MTDAMTAVEYREATAKLWDALPINTAIEAFCNLHAGWGLRISQDSVIYPGSYLLFCDGEKALQAAVIVLSCEALEESI